MKHRATLFLLVLLLQTPIHLFSQVIWTEDFTFPDGTTVGPAGKWTSVCGACVAGDYFEVRSNAFEASDVNDFSTWTSEQINITTCGQVDFSMDAIEIGDHEGPGCGCAVNIDYFDIYYSINGGAFTVIEDWMNDGEIGHTLTGDSQNGVFTDADWGSHTVTQTGLSGNTLQLQVIMRNTAGSERLILDNIVVNCSPLPIELLSLDAVDRGDHVEINWETAQESNTDYFVVERSTDGKAFFSMGTVAAAGNSDEVLAYSYIDPVPASGPTWYRLRQYDLDGSYEVTRVVAVHAPVSGIEVAALYPNPVSDRLNLRVVAAEETPVRLQVVDLMGRVLRTEALTLVRGENVLQRDVADLSAGIYILRMTGADRTISQRFRID